MYRLHFCLRGLTKNHLWYPLSYRCLSRVLCGGAKETAVPVESARFPVRAPLTLQGKKRKTPNSLCAIGKAIWWKNGQRVVVGAMKFDHVSCEVMHNHHRSCQSEDIVFYQQWLNAFVHARHFFSSIELQKTILVQRTKTFLPRGRQFFGHEPSHLWGPEDRSCICKWPDTIPDHELLLSNQQSESKMLSRSVAGSVPPRNS